MAVSRLPDPLLSLADVRRILGISQPTLARLVARGDLRSVKIGARRLVEPSALRAFIAARRRGPP